MKTTTMKTVALALSAVLVIGFGGYYAYKTFAKKEQVASTTFTPDKSTNVETDLPKPEQVKEDTPFLYDFVNSTLGFKADIDATKHWNEIFLVKTPKGNYHVESYINASGSATPVWGSTTYHLKLKNDKAFDKALEALPEGYKFVEGDYKFYLIPMNQVGLDGMYGGEDLAFITAGYPATLTTDEGYYHKHIYTKFGWPTKWLRKSPYKEEILSFLLIDISDPFWNDHNLYEKTIYKGNNLPDLEVKTIDVDLYEYSGFEDGERIRVNERQLKKALESMGYEK